MNPINAKLSGSTTPTSLSLRKFADSRFHSSSKSKVLHSGFKQTFKEILSPKRLSIIAAIFLISHITGNIIRKALGVNKTNDYNSLQPSRNQSPNQTDELIKEASISFIQLLISSLLAFGLENLFINKNFNLKNAFKEATSNDSLKLAFALSIFNSAVETGGHYLQMQQTSSNNQKLIDLVSSLIQMIGSFTLARFIAGAHSISAVIASSCRCCGLPLCAVELFNIFNSGFKFLIGAFREPQNKETVKVAN